MCTNKIYHQTFDFRCIPRWHPLRRSYQLYKAHNTWSMVSLKEFEGTDVTMKNILHRYRITDESFTTESIEICAR